jgi:hypothetical protein
MRRNNVKLATGLLGLSFGLGLLAAPARAQDKERTAEDVLADYARAVGGEAAWKAHKTMRMKRAIEAKGMQIQGTEERYATAAGKSLNVTELAAVGKLRQGSNGKVRWSEDPINGLRLLTGAEDEEARIESTWNADVKLKTLYQKVRRVPPPASAPAGQRLECVELVAKLAKPAVTCFDAETHFRVLQSGVHATAQGDVPYSVTFSDWRAVAGVSIPHLEEMTAGPLTLEARVVELVFDEKLDARMFDVPAAARRAKK